MRCPACRAELLIVEYAGVELDVCARCDGMWFDADELARLLGGERRVPRGTGVAPTAARRRCPRCRRRMLAVVMPGEPAPVTVDRCPRGDGLWFDRGELPRLVDAEVPPDDPAFASMQRFLGRFAEPARGREE